MRLKTAARQPALSDQLRRILLDGPHALGLTYHDLPPHAELRAAWLIHGAALKASRPRRRVWFEDRDLFVRVLHGER